MEAIIWYYLLLINIVAFFVCRKDKILSKKHKKRISEKTLFVLAMAGGSIGLLAGMRLFRHKTLHKRFSLGVPFILFVQAALYIYLRK